MAQGNMIDAQPSTRAAGSIVANEVARFDALAAEWWDPAGPMRALHEMNPLRVGWIDRRIRARRAALGCGGPGRLLDIGCGAGLAAEALAGLGHDVLGLDAAGDAIAAAEAHAAGQDLSLAYRTGAAEDLVAEGARFPVVTALEVIEHVADPAAFLRLLARLVEPGGLLFVSTLNRTLRSLAIAKLGAEYVVRLLPIGTHDWQRFVTPAELGTYGKAAGFRVADISGMLFDLRSRRWRAGTNLAVNYIAMLERR
jgi:2-polyprenyl-6-hydroxyphenyl methylase / 3-demethylubiquinone-9 3-methyltransferase